MVEPTSVFVLPPKPVFAVLLLLVIAPLPVLALVLVPVSISVSVLLLWLWLLWVCVVVTMTMGGPGIQAGRLPCKGNNEGGVIYKHHESRGVACSAREIIREG